MSNYKLKNSKSNLHHGLLLIVLIFLLSRMLIIFSGFIGIEFIPKEFTHQGYYLDNEFLNGWAQYDASAYLDIAKNGYNNEFNKGMGNTSWFPLFSIMIYLLHFFFGYGFAGFLISNISLFIALVFMYKLIRFDFSENIAILSIIFLLFFPTSFFLTAIYSESLFILLSIMSFYFARKNNWLWSGIFGGLSTLTRLTGIFIFVPLFYLNYSKNRFDKTSIKNYLCLLFIPLALVILSAYFLITEGNALRFMENHSKFNKYLAFPWTAIFNEFSHIINAINVYDFIFILYHSFYIILTFFFIYLLYLSYKYLHKDYFMFFFINMLIPLIGAELQGMVRYFLIMFPAFIMMAKLYESQNYWRIILKISYFIFVILSFIFTVRHVNGGFIIG